MRKYSFYLGIFFLCLLVLSGCGKLERKGTEADNVPPKVYFTNIPPEGTQYSVNPEVHWFGTDIDGFITAYQYAVMPKDSVFSRWDSVGAVKRYLHDIPSDSVSWVDQTTLMDMLGAHIVAEPGGHKRKVMMFAHIVDTIYTPQYIFLRAVDNGGEVSEVINMLLSRNNHRPKALIDMDSASLAAFVAKGHYCLEDTTATWKGISLSWVGWDSLDYPDKRIQPEFQFKWELVGPFDSASAVDTEDVVASSLDSVLIAGEWHTTRWVSEKTHVFWGLENSGDLGYGWYQLRVRARDDALVSHDTAATLDFRILKPKFRYDKDDPEGKDRRKTILVVDATGYRGKAGGVLDPEDVRSFYQEALDSLPAELCHEFELWYDTASPAQSPTKDPPGEDVLSRYDLVLVLNLGSSGAITDESFKRYKEYLNVGGRLWLIGMNNFNLDDTKRGYHSLDEIRGTHAYDVATQYCGLEGMFIPTLTLIDTMTLEFIGVEPFGLWEDEDLPTLEQDPIKGKEQLFGYDSTIQVRNFGVRGLPYVCHSAMSNNRDFARRIPYQRRICSFVSYFGSISPMHDRPCAVNYIGSTYRTADFDFPLNLMKNESPDYPVFKVMEKVVDWFMEDLP